MVLQQVDDSLCGNELYIMYTGCAADVYYAFPRNAAYTSAHSNRVWDLHSIYVQDY